MKLPHIQNSSVAQENAEAVFSNLYEFQLTPPAGIPIVNHLADEITSISGLAALEALPEVKKQKARGHTRIYTTPYVDDTTVPLTMNINLNAHGKNADQIVIYEMFKQWARRNRDERNGAMGIKPNQIGQGILTQNNKAGFVFRRVNFTKILVESISYIDEIALENGDPVNLTVNLIAEEFELMDAGTV